MADKEGTVRQNAEAKLTAIKPASSTTAGEWFIFHTVNGGYYGDGKQEEVETWPVMVPKTG